MKVKDLEGRTVTIQQAPLSDLGYHQLAMAQPQANSNLLICIWLVDKKLNTCDILVLCWGNCIDTTGLHIVCTCQLPDPFLLISSIVILEEFCYTYFQEDPT